VFSFRRVRWVRPSPKSLAALSPNSAQRSFRRQQTASSLGARIVEVGDSGGVSLDVVLHLVACVPLEVIAFVERDGV
jgi:hypothetical protein